MIISKSTHWLFLQKKSFKVFFLFIALVAILFNGAEPFEQFGRGLAKDGWLVGFGFNGPLRQYFSLYRAVSQREGERRERIDESKNVQTTPTRTYYKRNRPLPYCNQNCRTPRHWKFTQHHRTTRPPPLAKEHFCEIISTSVHWFSRRSCFKLFSIYSPAGHFVQQSGRVRAILVDSHLRNTPVKLFQSRCTG